MTIDCSLKFDMSTGKIWFIDSTGSGHANQADAFGIVKVSIDDVVLYANENWDDNDFSTPDTKTGQWTILLATVDIPIIYSFLKSKIKIEYKLTNDGTGDIVSSDSQEYDLDYTSPTAVLETDVDYTEETITLTDSTDYGTTLNDLSDTRMIEFNYPDGSGFSPISGSGTSVEAPTVGISGDTESTLESFPEYRITESGANIDIVIVDQITASTEDYIVSIVSQINVFNCLSKLVQKYYGAVESSSGDQLYYKRKLMELTYYSILYKSAYDNNLEYTYFLTRIYKLTSECDCSITSYTGYAANDSTVDVDVYSYLLIQYKELYEQLQYNKREAKVRSDILDMIIVWYTLYSIASENDKASCIDKLNYYMDDYTNEDFEEVTDDTDYSNCKSKFIVCMNTLTRDYESNKLNDHTYIENKFGNIGLLVSFYSLFMLAEDVIGNKEYPCEIMRELSFACNCSDGTSSPVSPSEDPYIYFGSLTDVDTIVEADVLGLAGSDQRATRFGNIENLAGGGYATIAMPVSFGSTGLFQYNSQNYQFTKKETLSITDGAGNTYNVDVWCWSNESYGDWDLIIPK